MKRMKKAKKEKGVKIMGYVYVGCRTTKERNARGEGLKVYEVSEVDGRWTEIQCLKTGESKFPVF